MKTGYVIMSGPFHNETDTFPIAVVKTKSGAEQWLRDNGWERGDKGFWFWWERDLGLVSECWFWARISKDKVEVIEQ